MAVNRVALCAAFLMQSGVVQAQDCLFNPFAEYEGWVEAGAQFDGTTHDGVQVDEWVSVRSESPFESVEFDAWDYGTGVLWAGQATMSGQRVIDSEPELYGPCSPEIEGYEWRFMGSATAGGLGYAQASGEVNFVLTEPVRLLARAEMAGSVSVWVSEVFSTGFGPSLNIIPSPLFHKEFIVSPGEYLLEFSCSYLDYKGDGTDGSLDLLLRFEPAKCSQADVNSDGYADIGDIGAFVTLFLTQDPAADFNGDGILDSGDIGTFVDAFLAGC